VKVDTWEVLFLIMFIFGASKKGARFLKRIYSIHMQGLDRC